MKSIDEHIKKDQSEIQTAQASGNDPKVHVITIRNYNKSNNSLIQET